MLVPSPTPSTSWPWRLRTSSLLTSYGSTRSDRAPLRSRSPFASLPCSGGGWPPTRLALPGMPPATAFPSLPPCRAALDEQASTRSSTWSQHRHSLDPHPLPTAPSIRRPGGSCRTGLRRSPVDRRAPLRRVGPPRGRHLDDRVPCAERCSSARGGRRRSRRRCQHRPALPTPARGGALQDGRRGLLPGGEGPGMGLGVLPALLGPHLRLGSGRSSPRSGKRAITVPSQSGESPGRRGAAAQASLTRTAGATQT